MFDTIKDAIGRDPDYPARTFDLDIRSRVLRGTLYESAGFGGSGMALPYEFHEEYTSAGQYIPLAKRRPSARYGLCKIIVRDSIALLFGEGRFPTVDCDDQLLREAIVDWLEEWRLPSVMTEAATRGAIGSVVVRMRVLKGRVFFDAMDTAYLTPTWKDDVPDELMSVVEMRKLRGSDLEDAGYTGLERGATYWFRREWSMTDEVWFTPLSIIDKREGKPFVRDTTRSVHHGLGFVPMVWIKNLPGGDELDGAPTFPEEVIRTGIEIDYLLSQNGRGLKYSLDPQLVLKEPASPDGELAKGGGNVIVVSEKGDADLLEISGTASDAVLEWVRGLRELALETAHGNRSNADKISAAQSGKALEMLHQPLIWLADDLRASYGQTALLELIRMVALASAKYPLVTRDGKPITLPPGERYTLRWPGWFSPTNDDKAQEAVALVALMGGGLMSRETGVKAVAETWDVGDIEAEITKIKADGVEADARAAQQAKDQTVVKKPTA